MRAVKAAIGPLVMVGMGVVALVGLRLTVPIPMPQAGKADTTMVRQIAHYRPAAQPRKRAPRTPRANAMTALQAENAAMRARMLVLAVRVEALREAVEALASAQAGEDVWAPSDSERGASRWQASARGGEREGW